MASTPASVVTSCLASCVEVGACAPTSAASSTTRVAPAIRLSGFPMEHLRNSLTSKQFSRRATRRRPIGSAFPGNTVSKGWEPYRPPQYRPALEEWMKLKLCILLMVCAALAIPAPAYTQGGTSSTLSGVVLDSGGGVIPGADVSVKNVAT